LSEARDGIDDLLPYLYKKYTAPDQVRPPLPLIVLLISVRFKITSFPPVSQSGEQIMMHFPVAGEARLVHERNI
jgi:hypothetical protein